MNGYKCAVIRKQNGSDGLMTYIDDGNLVSRSISGGKLSDREEILSTDGCGDFDAVADKSGYIHIFYGDSSGGLVYLRNTSDSWQRRTLISADPETSSRVTRIFAFKNNAVVTLIYIMTRGEQSVLTMQAITNADNKPTMVDRIYGSAYALQNENGDITVFYLPHQNSSFGFKTYYWSKKEWSEFMPLAISQSADFLLPCYHQSNIALCFKEDGELKFTIIENGTCREIQTLSRRHSKNADLPILSENQEKLTLMWLEKGRTFSTETELTSIRWSRLREDFADSATPDFTAKLITTSGVDYDILSISDAKIFGRISKEIFSEAAAGVAAPVFKRRGEDVERFAFPSAVREHSPEEIVRHKQELSRMLGVNKPQSAAPSAIRGFEGSSDFLQILSSLKAELDIQKRETARLKNTIRLLDRKISAKMHKN